MDSKYIFIDLEWERRGKRSSKKDVIVEIGAARLNKDSSFIKYINDNDINRNTRKFLGINQKNINEGISIIEAVLALKEYSEGTDIVIVWSSDTADKLKICASLLKISAEN